jgi:hypothetical protein
MDKSLQNILDSLPPKPSRSKLEPYREFIRELRRRGRSYQEITQILSDHCGVSAAVHSVYNFVRVREKAERKPRIRENSSPRSAEPAKSPEPAKGRYLQPRLPALDDTWKNIETVKQRQCQCGAEEKVFVYDENEPLKLLRGDGGDSAGETKTKPER